MIPTLATSTFCGPCKMLKSRLDAGGFSYAVADMMEDRIFFQDNAVRSVPTLVTESGNISGVDAILAYFQENP